MGLLGYGFRSFSRNPGRTASIVLGVAVAVALMAGTTIATESMVSYKISQILGDTIVDIQATSAVADQSAVPALFQSLQAQTPEIELFFPAIHAECHSQADLNGTGFIPQCFFGGVDAGAWANPRLNRIINLTAGEYPQNATSILVDAQAARQYNITAGANVTFAFQWSWAEDPIPLNLTVAGTFAVLDYETLSTIFHAVGANHTCILSNFAAMESIVSHFDPVWINFIYQLPKSNYNFLINRDYVNVLDITGTVGRLNQLTNKIYAQGGYTYSFYVENALGHAIIVSQSAVLTLGDAMQLAALPGYMLGIYLTVVLTNQVIERRLPEMGQLRSRGASKKQIATWFAVESAIIGAAGGALGYVGGYGASYLVLPAVMGADFPAMIRAGTLHASLGSLVAAIMLGVGACLLALIGPLRRVNKLVVVDATKEYLHYTTAQPWRSRLDLPILLLGALPIAWSFFFTPEAISALPSMIRGEITFWTNFMANLAIYAPFLLAFGITKIVAGWSPRLLARLAQTFARVFGRNEALLIGRNIGRRPKQSGGLLFLLSLTLCFGIVTPIANASGAAYASDLTCALVGADIKIYRVQKTGQTSFDYAFRDSLLSCSTDILSVTPVTSTIIFAQGYSYGSGGIISGNPFHLPFTAIGVNVSEYQNGVYFRPTFSVTRNPLAELAKLAEKPNGTLLTRQWGAYNEYKVGDNFSIHVNQADTEALTFEVVGFLDVIPGSSYDNHNNFEMAVFNLDFLNSTMFPNITAFTYSREYYLVRLKPGATTPASVLANQLEAIFTADIDKIDTAQSVQARLGAERVMAILNVLDVEYIFIALVATLGLTILLSRSFLERRREVATLRARGMSRQSLVRMEAGEGLTLIMFGFLVSLVGIFIGYALSLQLPQFFVDWRIFILHPLVVPPQVFWYIGVTMSVLAVVAWIISAHEVRKTNPPALSGCLRVY